MFGNYLLAKQRHCSTWCHHTVARLFYWRCSGNNANTCVLQGTYNFVKNTSCKEMGGLTRFVVNNNYVKMFNLYKLNNFSSDVPFSGFEDKADAVF